MRKISYAGLLFSGMLFSCITTAQSRHSASSLIVDSFSKHTKGSLLLEDARPCSVANSEEDAHSPATNTNTSSAAFTSPFAAKTIILPTVMIGYGAYTFNSKPLKNLNLSLRKELWQERRNNKKLPFDNFSLVAPAVAVYALNAAGVKGRHNFVDRSILFGMSNLLGQGMVSIIKRSSNVLRPDSTNRLSFPSGHTAQAFISAEFLRQEYKDVSPWYGIAGYAVAAGTGFLRMYNNKHWFNDVVAGAGVGILSTRISYWLYPKIRNSIFSGRKSQTLLVPTYQNKAVGVSMVHKF